MESSETNRLCVSQSAARQGNRLHMNVYETRGQPARVSTTKASGAEPKRGFRPPQHCPALAQVVSRKVQAAVPEQGMVRPPHRDSYLTHFAILKQFSSYFSCN